MSSSRLIPSQVLAQKSKADDGLPSTHSHQHYSFVPPSVTQEEKPKVESAPPSESNSRAPPSESNRAPPSESKSEEPQPTVSFAKASLANHLCHLWKDLVFAEVQKTLTSSPKEEGEVVTTTHRYFGPDSWRVGREIDEETYEGLSISEKQCVVTTISRFHGFAKIKGVKDSRSEKDHRLGKIATFNTLGGDELCVTPYQITNDMEATDYGRFENVSRFPKSTPRRGQMLCGYVSQSKRDKERYHFYKWFVASRQFFEFWKMVMTRSLPSNPAEMQKVICRPDLSSLGVTTPWNASGRRWAAQNLEMGATLPELRHTYATILAYLLKAEGKGFPKDYVSSPLWKWFDVRFR